MILLNRTDRMQVINGTKVRPFRSVGVPDDIIYDQQIFKKEEILEEIKKDIPMKVSNKKNKTR